MEALKVHGQMIAARPNDPRWEQARRRMVQLNLKVGRWRSALGAGQAVDAATTPRPTGSTPAPRRPSGCPRRTTRRSTRPGRSTRRPRPRSPATSSRPRNWPGSTATGRRTPRRPSRSSTRSSRTPATSPRSTPPRCWPGPATTPRRSTDPQAVEKAVRRRRRRGPRRPRRGHAPADRRRDRLAAAPARGRPPPPRRDRPGAARTSATTSGSRTSKGSIDLAESRPEEAIRAWRTGLLEIGGNDAALTWQLAHVLLEVGRVSEAEPLIDQYRRLVGGDDAGPEIPLPQGPGDAPVEPARRGGRRSSRRSATRSPSRSSRTPSSPSARRTRRSATRPRRWTPTGRPPRGRGSGRRPGRRSPGSRPQAHPEEAQATLQKGLTLNPDDAELLTAAGRVRSTPSR